MDRRGSTLWRQFERQTRTRRGVMRAGVASLFGIWVAADRCRGLVLAQEGTPCPSPTTEEATALAEAYFAAFNAGDAAALGDLLAPDYRHHGALVSEQDRQLHMERLKNNYTAFPGGHYDVEDIIANGDLVAVRNVFTGTLQAPYAGVDPAGQPVAVRAVHIHRIACGKIAETWNSGDGLGLLRQIGALPSPGPAPRTAEDVAATPIIASPASACPLGAAEENAAIARRWTEEALDRHELDILDEFVAPDMVHHAGIFVDEVGRDRLKEDLAALLAAFPDIRFTADVVVADEDGAAVRWTGAGTHNGPLQSIAPTGKQIVFTGINVYRIACGQIVEGWSEPDSLGLLRQLGAVPEIAPVVGTPAA